LLKMGWKSEWSITSCISNIVRDLEKRYND